MEGHIMPRALRNFRPDALYHVVNHGQAHAPVFETAADVERFMSLLGWATVEGWIRVLAYVFLATHFHLILESVDGRLDRAMRRIEAAFGVWHNRTRERTGHVLKGRYFARPIRGAIDLAATLAYVDLNPVTAGMVSRPDAYPHGSAHAYVEGGRPRWLARDGVEDLICRLTLAGAYEGALYPRLWAWARAAGAGRIVEEASKGRRTALADVPLLATAGPEHVQRWLREHRQREEGRDEACIVLAPEAVLGRSQELSPSDRDQLVAGMLSQVAGCTTTEIGRALGISQATASRRVRDHRQRLGDDAAYVTRAACFVQSAMRSAYGALATCSRE